MGNNGGLYVPSTEGERARYVAREVGESLHGQVKGAPTVLPSLSGLQPHDPSGSLKYSSVCKTDSGSMDKSGSLGPPWPAQGPGACVFNKLSDSDVAARKEGETVPLVCSKAGDQASAVAPAEKSFPFSEQKSGRMGRKPSKPNRTEPQLHWTGDGWEGES